MRGIDWVAFPIIAERYGAKDLDLLIDQLLTMREFFNAKS